MGKGLCNRHLIQIKRHGKITDKSSLEDMAGEEWKKFEHPKISECSRQYFISNMGRVKSVSNRGSERILTLRWDMKMSKGMVFVCGVGNREGGRPFMLRREVARVFMPGFSIHRKLIFINGNAEDCRVSNLCWMDTNLSIERIKNLEREAKKGQDAIDIYRFMRGDAHALDRIIVEFGKKITRFLYNKAKSGIHINVEDLVQDILTRAVSAIQRGLLGTVENLNAWFYRIAKNILKNELSRKRIRTTAMTIRGKDGEDDFEYADVMMARKWVREGIYAPKVESNDWL